jgi:hypothetical protein
MKKLLNLLAILTIALPSMGKTPLFWKDISKDNVRTSWKSRYPNNSFTTDGSGSEFLFLALVDSTC